jgi:hypothetical protein
MEVTMHRFVLCVVWVFVFVVSPAMRALAIEASAGADAIKLQEKGKVLGDHAKDLAVIGRQIKASVDPGQIQDLDGIRRAYADLHEHNIAMNLSQYAFEEAKQLLIVSDLLLVYGHMSCDLDKALMRPVLQAMMRTYAEEMDDAVGLVNHGLAQTRQPGVATTAARIRDDLRENKALIESIVLR